MKIDIELTLADWRRFNHYLLRRNQRALKGIANGGVAAHLIVFALLTVLFTPLFLYLDSIHVPTAIFTGMVAVVIMTLFVINLMRLQRALAPSGNGPFVGRHRFVFDAEGIQTTGNGYRSFHEWRTVRSVKRHDGLIMLFLDTSLAFILPEDRLAAPDDLFDLLMHHTGHNGLD